MEKPFYITDALNKIGPFSREEVLQMLYSSHISITDYIIDARDNRMCPLLQHEDFGGDGGTHSQAQSVGIAGLSPKSLQSKYGFGELRKQIHKDRESKINDKRFSKSQIAQGSSHLNEVIAARPDLKVNSASTSVGQTPKPPTPKPPPPPQASQQPNRMKDTSIGVVQNSILINSESTTTTLKHNTSANFFVRVKGKEFGPVKFLVLLSLLKQNKIGLEVPTKNDHDNEWKTLSDYIPPELQQTIHISPVSSQNVLPKAMWKRKNVRVDYEEMVVCHNERYSFVGKSIDLSAEGMAVVWVYDAPVNEEFELSFFDLEKNLVTVKAILNRKEQIVGENDIPLFKAVFIFKDKIQIKNFIA